MENFWKALIGLLCAFFMLLIAFFFLGDKTPQSYYLTSDGYGMQVIATQTDYATDSYFIPQGVPLSDIPKLLESLNATLKKSK